MHMYSIENVCNIQEASGGDCAGYTTSGTYMLYNFQLCIYLSNKHAFAMYYTVTKHDGILEHVGKVENTRLRLMFSTFHECSQMS